jgi:L-cysteine/cystine lyase
MGAGLLYVAPRWRDRCPPLAPTYANLAEPGRGLDAVAWDDARAHDASAVAVETSAFAIAAHDVLAEAGWPEVHARARALAGLLVDALRERGREVAPRGDTTLVAWHDDDAPATRDRLAAARVVVRDLPGRPIVRASLGAWNSEDDLERLLAGL